MTEQIQMQENAPNAVAALVLGILSVLSGCLFIGLILGIIGLVLANKGLQIYYLSPSSYKNVGMLNTGKILSIIGIVLGGLAIIMGIISAVVLGGSLFFLEDFLDFFWFLNHAAEYRKLAFNAHVPMFLPSFIWHWLPVLRISAFYYCIISGWHWQKCHPFSSIDPCSNNQHYCHILFPLP